MANTKLVARQNVKKYRGIFLLCFGNYFFSSQRGKPVSSSNGTQQDCTDRPDSLNTLQTNWSNKIKKSFGGDLAGMLSTLASALVIITQICWLNAIP